MDLELYVKYECLNFFIEITRTKLLKIIKIEALFIKSCARQVTTVFLVGTASESLGSRIK